MRFKGHLPEIDDYQNTFTDSDSINVCIRATKLAIISITSPLMTALASTYTTGDIKLLNQKHTGINHNSCS